MLFWMRFGRVWGTVFGAFWAIWIGFWGFEKESNFEAEVGSRKSGFKFVRGNRGVGLATLILMEDIYMYRNKDQIGNH